MQKAISIIKQKRPPRPPPTPPAIALALDRFEATALVAFAVMLVAIKLVCTRCDVDVENAEGIRDVDWSCLDQQSDPYLLNTKIRTVKDSTWLEVLVEAVVVTVL